MCAKPALPCRRSVRMRPATRTGGLAASRVAASADAYFSTSSAGVAVQLKLVGIGLMPASFNFGKLLLTLKILVLRLKR